MSARKLGPRTPGSGLKSKQPIPKHVLNSTMISKSPPRLKGSLNVNNTLGNIGPQLALKVNAPDLRLQCDLAYSAYLRALITKDIMQISIKDYEEAADDQLSQQAELLQRTLSEQSKLESEINDLEIQIEIEKLSEKLKQIYSLIDEIVRDYNINANVEKCNASLENACNKLYLKNIQRFKSQEDYDKFTTALESCTGTMKKLQTAIGNMKEMQILGDRIKTFLSLQEGFSKKQKILADLQIYIGFSLFKNTSDKFAAIRGYIEE